MYIDDFVPEMENLEAKIAYDTSIRLNSVWTLIITSFKISSSSSYVSIIGMLSLVLAAFQEVEA